MNIYIFDLEVFEHDWLAVFRDPTKEDHVVIHNDTDKLRNFLKKDGLVIGGFNNKHYDNWILKTIINGGGNAAVKACNDWIIKEGRNGWDYPFLRGGNPLPCKTFDLRDDIADMGISLKAIEGNLKLPIVESSVPFDLRRPLTDEELKETIHYCKHDVDSTVKLYEARKEEYLDAKLMVSELYHLPKEDALGLTNAKLSARVLDATKVERTDEREYVIPDNIDTDKIPDIVLDFFNQIHDDSIPDAKLFGTGKAGSKGMTLEAVLKTGGGECPITYAWGGVHGAKPCVTVEETADRVIINQDVSSLYPNSMINFGYCSRSMSNPKAYEDLVNKRVGYKHAGDKKKANSLKLVVNTVYGAMLNQYNDLADRLAGRSVCITNQLAMSMLITLLAEECETIDFVNINTDGIMFTIDRKEVDLSESIVADWCKTTGFEMERDDFVKVIQKDVNNYIGIKANGEFKTKGGYVSLYKGGNFKTNSLAIIDKSIVDYLVKGIPPENTIKECTDIFSFQKIVKTGSTYEGSYQYINDYELVKEMRQVNSMNWIEDIEVSTLKGTKIPIQNVNRVYAVKDERYGPIVKGKWITERRTKNKSTGLMESVPVDPPKWSESVIPECPNHAGIDNENRLSVKDLDLDYYIDMAKKRIDKYLHIDKTVERKINKIEKEIIIMATKKEEATQTLNVYQKLNEARKRFLESGIKKEGVNRYAEFKYFRLDEIIPVKQSIFKELGLTDVISFGTEVATLTLINNDNTDETIDFMSQLAPDESMIKNPIQKVGAIQTYVRRYLYMLMLDIIESDGIEETTGKKEEPTPVITTVKKSNKPATPVEREEAKKTLTNADGDIEAPQKKALSNGLKKLRAKYMNANKEVTDEALKEKYEPFIKEVSARVKAGMTKTEADELLIKIGNMIQEK